MNEHEAPGTAGRETAGRAEKDTLNEKRTVDRAEYDRLKEKYDTDRAEYDRLKKERDTDRAEYDQLKKERDTDRAEYDQLKKEYEEFRRGTERENRLRERRESLRGALKKAGVEKEELLELLLCAPEANEESLPPNDAAARLKSRFGACFETPAARGVDPVSPPRASALPEDRDLSDEEYYRRVPGMPGEF